LVFATVSQREVVRKSGDNVQKAFVEKMKEGESFTVVVLEMDGPKVLQAGRLQGE
jgi:hypothetical protein